MLFVSYIVLSIGKSYDGLRAHGVCSEGEGRLAHYLGRKSKQLLFSAHSSDCACFFVCRGLLQTWESLCLRFLVMAADDGDVAFSFGGKGKCAYSAD